MSAGDSDPMWVSLADAVSKWATTFAIIGTGTWALFHFYLRRESQTALTIDMTASSIEYTDSRYLVNFDVCLTNKGQVAIRAERTIRPAYNDKDEHLDYGGDLLVRRIAPDLTANHPVNWFIEDHQHSPEPNDLESDLLRIFRDADDKTDFWIEPGEFYHVSSGYTLEKGNYLVMVTFVGSRGAEDFWRRVFLIQVPTPAKSTSGSETPIGAQVPSTL